MQWAKRPAARLGQHANRPLPPRQSRLHSPRLRLLGVVWRSAKGCAEARRGKMCQTKCHASSTGLQISRESTVGQTLITCLGQPAALCVCRMHLLQRVSQSQRRIHKLLANSNMASPAGYNCRSPQHSHVVASLAICTGADVRVSTPCSNASAPALSTRGERRVRMGGRGIWERRLV